MNRLAVIGHPVAHSLSPRMQTAALEVLGLAGEWSYEAIDVAPGELPARVAELAAEGYVGLNVTIPHKEGALALSTEASERASAIGAANTLTLGAGGAVHADNTDAPGLMAALPRDPRGERALVLGAGGSARAAVWALREAGADVHVWNRTPEKAHRLAKDLRVSAADAGSADWGLRTADFALIVNATAAGLVSTPGRSASQLKQLPLAADSFSDRQVVVDLVYGPEDTELVRAARAAGAEVADGREILVRQGAISLESWTGLRAPIDVMRQAISNDTR